MPERDRNADNVPPCDEYCSECGTGLRRIVDGIEDRRWTHVQDPPHGGWGHVPWPAGEFGLGLELGDERFPGRVIGSSTVPVKLTDEWVHNDSGEMIDWRALNREQAEKGLPADLCDEEGNRLHNDSGDPHD